ncbi:MAG: UDP-N-acetylglucosamine 2-epimerase (hydrolyzing) [Planctomycetes bacterium]|nr:UDP-N-acetylglucosamine 2-epimerase (hydrolyzing) [Planctomycetota bacterium]
MTGTRAEYGLLGSTMAAINRHRRLELQLAVTGMHLLRGFGHTVNEIKRDGWRIDARVRMQRGNDDPLDQALGLSRGIAGLARFFDAARTDVVLVLGDRIEAMAAALAAVSTGRILGHIHGGDVAPGDFDDSMRHAISKLAHVHFAATRASARRLVRMGESPQRVHHVGAPGMDRLRQLAREASDKGNGRRDYRGVGLVVQHPLGRSAARERRIMAELLRAVADAGLSRTIIYPNSDRGHRGIIAAIDAHLERARNGDVSVIRSLDRDHYLQTLIGADVIIGNSSSGIIEAAVAGTPSVNVGDRQRGREPAGSSIVQAGESYDSIREALACARRKRPRIGRSTVYGDGDTGSLIAKIVASIPIDEAYRRKQIVY